jgi:hypothetical protein
MSYLQTSNNASTGFALSDGSQTHSFVDGSASNTSGV